MIDEKHKKWVEKNPQWNRTYKRLKHQNDRDKRRRMQQIEELEEISETLHNLKTKVNYMIGHLRKTFNTNE